MVKTGYARHCLGSFFGPLLQLSSASHISFQFSCLLQRLPRSPTKTDHSFSEQCWCFLVLYTHDSISRLLLLIITTAAAEIIIIIIVMAVPVPGPTFSTFHVLFHVFLMAILGDKNYFPPQPCSHRRKVS